MEQDKTPLGIRLNSDDADDIRQQVYALLNSAVDEVRHSAAIGSPWLKGKKAAREYLHNISEQKFEELNLPCHRVDNIYFFNKKEIDKHIFEMY